MKAKKGLNLFDRFILWLNIFFCLLILISYLAPVADPQKYWMVSFFGLAYPILLCINIVFVIYWALRKKLLVLLSLLTILAGWKVLNRNIGLRFPTSAKAPTHNLIRLMTYNVHNFKRYGSKNDVPTKHEILQLIAGQQPDVIAFQEFYTRYRGQYAMPDSIKQMAGTKFYYFEPLVSNAQEAVGLAIFSKYPIMKRGFIRLTENNSENQCLYIDIKKDSMLMRIYTVHLRSIKFDPEDYRYINAIAQQGKKPDIGSTKRLGSKLKLAFIKRSQQVALMKDSLANCPYPYVVMGDFNDTPTSFAVNRMSQGLKDAFCEKGSGLGRTYNGNFPNYQIDYVMASKQFDVASYQIIEKRLSDHYPVCADLLFK